MSWFTRSQSISAKRSISGSTVRLGVEAMEERMALSASSFNLHAIKETNGATAAFFRGLADDAFYEKTPGGSILKLDKAHSVSDYSAGLDTAGHAVVFAHRKYTGPGNVHPPSLWEHDAGGWHELKPPVAIQSFAAVNGDRCYAAGADHSFWEYVGPHTTTITVYNRILHRNVTLTTHFAASWTKLPGKVYGLDAVTQSNGADFVTAIDANNDLQTYANGTWQMLLQSDDGDPLWNSFSVGLGTNGKAETWVLTDDHWPGPRLVVYHSPSDYFLLNFFEDDLSSMSATSGGQTFILYNHDDQHEMGRYVENPDAGPETYSAFAGNLSRPGSIFAFSAVGPSDVFVLTTDGHLMESMNGGWAIYN